MIMECGEITREIIRIFYKVYNALGDGFLEKVYVGAMKVEFDKVGLKCVRELPIKVNYEGVVVGEYFCDLLVEEKVLIEVKAVPELRDKDERQLRNYLKGTLVEVGLLVNFGDEPKFRRQIYLNENKKGLGWVFCVTCLVGFKGGDLGGFGGYGRIFVFGFWCCGGDWEGLYGFSFDIDKKILEEIKDRISNEFSGIIAYEKTVQVVDEYKCGW